MGLSRSAILSHNFRALSQSQPADSGLPLPEGPGGRGGGGQAALVSVPGAPGQGPSLVLWHKVGDGSGCPSAVASHPRMTMVPSIHLTE